MSVIIDTDPDLDDLVRLDNLQGADEANIAGRSFREIISAPSGFRAAW